MADPRSLQTLQQAVRRESNSLLQYMAGAFPWTTALRTEALERLETIVLAEREGLAGLTRYLYRHKIAPPPSGGYPTDFTSLNFIDLGYLVPLLVKDQKDNIARLEAELHSVADAEARSAGEEFLAVKRRHLHALEQLQVAEPAVMP
jgi:hypothetical protein